jgi:hypothetical protein
MSLTQMGEEERRIPAFTLQEMMCNGSAHPLSINAGGSVNSLRRDRLPTEPYNAIALQ